jgi:hypothetical protein
MYFYCMYYRSLYVISRICANRVENFRASVANLSRICRESVCASVANYAILYPRQNLVTSELGHDDDDERCHLVVPSKEVRSRKLMTQGRFGSVFKVLIYGTKCVMK